MSPRTQPVNIQAQRAPAKTLVEIEGTGKLESVAIDSLKFDHIYQRDLSAAHVQEMAEHWDPRVAGAIVVNRRPNGELQVIDGQHRTAAAKTAGETNILALVFEGLEQKSEAGMRVKGNFRRPDNPQERFRARVAAGEKEAMAIAKICKDYNTRINPTPQNGTGINAISSVEKLFNKDGGVTLSRVFDIIQRAWGDVGGDHASVAVLKGLGWLLEHNSDKLDTNRLVDRLQAEGSSGIYRKAQSHQAAHQGSFWVNWYRALIEIYNTKLPEGKRLKWSTTGRGGAGTKRGQG
jgi:hypothetical protein